MILNSKEHGGSIKDIGITDGDKVTGTAPFSYISTDASGNDIYTDPNEVTKTVKSGDAKISSDWTETTLPVNAYWFSVCYGNGKFVAVVWDSNIAAYSIDTARSNSLILE